MKDKQGFTLVELLVVMAIIAILASIVVPNVSRYILRGRVTRALAEVNHIETALTAMLADAERSELGQILDPDGIRSTLGVAPGAMLTSDQMNRAIELYTTVFYELLRQGRSVLSDGSFERGLIRDNVVVKLGTGYLDIGTDPWGNDYRIFPGPWSGRRDVNPIIFRKFTVDAGEGGRAARTDALSAVLPDGNELGVQMVGELGDEASDEYPGTVGYPADRNKIAYIWSFGANLRSGQMVYRNDGYPEPRDIFSLYANETDPEYFFGGDDINNWDKGASWGRFYN